MLSLLLCCGFFHILFLSASAVITKKDGVVTYHDLADTIFDLLLKDSDTNFASEKTDFNAHIFSSLFPNVDLKSTVSPGSFDQVVQNVSADVPTECTRDFVFFLNSLRKKQSWAFKVADSYGRPRTGLLKGNIKWTGNYEECLEVDIRPRNGSTLDGKFQAQYCQATFATVGAPTLLVPGSQILGDLMIGMCLPKSCNASAATKTIKDALEFFSLFIHPGIKMFDFVGVSCPQPRSSMDTSGIIGLIVLVVLLTCIIVGSVLEWWQDVPSLALTTSSFSNNTDGIFTISRNTGTTPENNNVVVENNPLPQEHTDTSHILTYDKMTNDQGCLATFYNSFSIMRNARKLLTTTTNESSDTPDLAAINGIRFLSLAWIILGHTFFFGFALTANPLDILDVNKHGLLFQSIVQCVFAADTFFLLSGCLLAYHFFALMERNSEEKLNSVRFWLSFYGHRIWRLTPTYAAILFVYVGLLKYIGDGPYWPYNGFEIENCRKTWWTNLLYINNLVGIYFNGTDGKLHREYCMGWTWYLSNEMQFFVLSPLVLYPLQRGMWRSMSGLKGTLWRTGGWMVLVVLAVISLAVTGGISAAHDLPPNLFPPNVTMAPKIEWMMSNVSYQPYNHAVCYLMGLALGYAFCQLRNRNPAARNKPEVPVRLPKVTVLVGWVVSSVMGFFVVFGLWRQYRGYVFPASLAAFYDSCSRLGWALVVGWVMFACLSGNGGLVNRLLSWKLFLPLSRMTYCAYLIHPMLMYCYYFSRRDTYYYTDFTMTWFFGAFVLFSYMAAFFVSLVFESPFLALDKIMFPSRRIKSD